MTDKKRKKMPIAQIVTIVLTIMAVGLLAFGAITPPPGEIHGSILQAAGILFGFAALWVAAHTIIEVYHDGKITAKVGNASLSIESENEDEK